jgi:hypothetical protein
MQPVEQPSRPVMGQSSPRPDSSATSTSTRSPRSVNDSKPPTSETELFGHQVIFQVRCDYLRPDGKPCNARLFDARAPWERISVDKASVVVRCWRCHNVMPVREFIDEGAPA